MIIILLPLERATIGQPSRYLQHVDRSSEKNFRGLWNEVLPQNYGFSKTLNLRSEVCFFDFFSRFFYISCHILRWTCRMILILLPLERATIGQPSRYLQHVDRPSEKNFRGLWNEVLPQNYDFPRNLNLRSEVCFFRFLKVFLHFLSYIAMYVPNMILILLSFERATIGQPSRYLQHVDRPS